jgi:ABC-2 type transport system permease protein
MNRKDFRKTHLKELVLIAGILVTINILAGLQFFRIDLTSEKRYTLARVTKNFLRELESPVFVKVYLEGDLPSDMLQFRKSVREILEEFRAYAGRNFDYTFVNLYDESDPAIRNRMMKELSDKGLRITDIRLKDKEGGTSTKLIIPGAIMNYRGADFPVNLLKNNPALPYQVNLNNSVRALEYEFIRAIKSLSSTEVEKIAFIEGNNELGFYDVYDLSTELSLFFQVDRGAIQGNLNNLLEYKAIIIAQPLDKYSEQDKFAIDQYIMHGGKALFFIDPVQTNADSLVSGQTFTTFLDLNLYDLLFKYGFRIDYNLIKDRQSSFIQVESVINNQEPELRLMPWYYFPLFSPSPDHFLTRGLNYIRGQFVSAIDTSSAPMAGIKRTVLLASSDSSARIDNPIMISMDELSRPPDSRVFNKSRLPVAILAEGVFESFYKNYGVPEGVKPANITIKSESVPTSIFVAGDGDLLRNEVQMVSGQTNPLPLGYDPDTRQTFGNKEFIMNVINYMTDDFGLISLRNREIGIRLLDGTLIRTKGQKLNWMLINILVPVLIVLAFALYFSYVRRSKYGKSLL